MTTANPARNKISKIVRLTTPRIERLAIATAGTSFAATMAGSAGIVDRRSASSARPNTLSEATNEFRTEN